MIHDVIFAVWFLLPAAAANVAPIITAKLPLIRTWDTPLDFGKTYRGKEIFGNHKSWRGLVSGIIIATITLALQVYCTQHYDWASQLVSPIDYADLPVLVLGPLFGIGALGGDAIESFFKRRRGIRSGHSWLPFDQLDYIIGGVLVSLPFIRLPFVTYIYIFVIWFFLHLAASYVGYRTGFKERPI